MDAAHKATDKILNNLTKELRNTYQHAYNELKKTMTDVMSKMQLDPNMTAEQRYALARKYSRLEKLEKQLATSLSKVNKEAVQMINNNMLNVYQINYDSAASLFPKDVIPVLDRSAIRTVLTGQVDPFTKLALDGLKDQAILRQSLTRELLTGIMQGDSIPHLAKRIKAVTEKSFKDSVRIARTETTRVENSARNDVGAQGEKKGFRMLKEWVATDDESTRDEHREMNGVKVPQNEPFVVGDEEMMYPGDISLGASGWNVINCRCTIVNIIEKKE